jgi:hypothetical protein
LTGRRGLCVFSCCRARPVPLGQRLSCDRAGRSKTARYPR